MKWGWYEIAAVILGAALGIFMAAWLFLLMG